MPEFSQIAGASWRSPGPRPLQTGPKAKESKSCCDHVLASRRASAVATAPAAKPSDRLETEVAALVAFVGREQRAAVADTDAGARTRVLEALCRVDDRTGLSRLVEYPVGWNQPSRFREILLDADRLGPSRCSLELAACIASRLADPVSPTQTDPELRAAALDFMERFTQAYADVPTHEEERTQAGGDRKNPLEAREEGQEESSVRLSLTGDGLDLRDFKSLNL